MGRKALTQKEVEEYCKPKGYKVLSPYINSHTKIILQNIKTNEIGEIIFNNFKQGHRFDNPRNPKKQTQQEVELYCESQDYKVLSEYVNDKIKIKLQNIKTGEIGEMLFRNFKTGHRFDNPKATKKLTQQEVEEYCLERGYRVLSPYINSLIKITLKNIKTGEIGEMKFSSFKQGCRFDNPKTKTKFTQQEVESYCMERGYRVLSPYVDSLIKIKLRNIKTNEIGEMRFSSFKDGQRFDNPRGRKTKFTQQEVESYCMERGYKVISPYRGSRANIKLQNIKTGEIGEMRFSNFKEGQRFDNPKGKKALTQQEVESYCLERDYKVLSKYVNNYTKITLQNINTDEIGEMRFGDFKKGQRFNTPKNQNNKLTYQNNKLTYHQYTQPFIDEGYTVLIDEKDYNNINSKSKIDVICSNKHKWSVARTVFTSQNQRCPMCNQDTGGMSLGEKLVYQLLQGNNINFEREKNIYINGSRYRFDFYFEVEEFGYTDKFFVEYDGEQHYHDVSGYFSEGLKKRQVSDKIKDKYAHENNIQMIRIPWLNNTIDKVLFVINGETGLNLQNVQVDLPTIQEIADYYLNHSIKATMYKFNIGNNTVDKYFKQIYRVNKREYIGLSEQEVADYYLSNSKKETMNKFNLSYTTVDRYFNQTYGTTKKEYLKIIDITK